MRADGLGAGGDIEELGEPPDERPYAVVAGGHPAHCEADLGILGGGTTCR